MSEPYRPGRTDNRWSRLERELHAEVVRREIQDEPRTAEAEQEPGDADA
jgi:hypothetical protein